MEVCYELNAFSGLRKAALTRVNKVPKRSLGGGCRIIQDTIRAGDQSDSITRGGVLMRKLILASLCVLMLLGCATTIEMTDEEKQDLRSFQKGSAEERTEIAKQYGIKEDLKKWETEINQKQIAKGMPKSAVLMSWGKPTLTEVSEDGRSEKWFYQRDFYRNYTLFFRDDKLERWRIRKRQRSPR